MALSHRNIQGGICDADGYDMRTIQKHLPFCPCKASEACEALTTLRSGSESNTARSFLRRPGRVLHQKLRSSPSPTLHHYTANIHTLSPRSPDLHGHSSSPFSLHFSTSTRLNFPRRRGHAGRMTRPSEPFASGERGVRGRGRGGCASPSGRRSAPPRPDSPSGLPRSASSGSRCARSRPAAACGSSPGRPRRRG